MDTIRAKQVIAKLFALLRQRRPQPAVRRRRRPRISTAPAATPPTPSPSAEGMLEASRDALSPEALRDAFRLIQRWRSSDSLTDVMADYRQRLLRRGWSEATTELRVSAVRQFIADAIGLADRDDAAEAALLREKLNRLRHAFDRRK
jgi:hypothetical protein